jgi:hypothetical protein
MGLLITTDDFGAEGRYAIATNNFTEGELNDYIDRYEEPFLIDLLGVALFDAFKADVDPITHIPITQIYLDIYNKMRTDEDTGGCVVNTIGLKNILLGVIYFYYQREMAYRTTINGIQQSGSETTKPIPFDYSNINLKWNDSYESALAIERYIQNNLDVYPNYNGYNFCRKYGRQHWAL